MQILDGARVAIDLLGSYFDGTMVEGLAVRTQLAAASSKLRAITARCESSRAGSVSTIGGRDDSPIAQ